MLLQVTFIRRNDKRTGRNDYIVHIMSENGLNMIDLVPTHLNQPWGPPWTLATLGNPCS